MSSSSYSDDSDSNHHDEYDTEEVRNLFDLRAKEIEGKLYPKKSENKYIQAWEQFENWLKEHKSNTYDESRFLVYFKELSGKYQPSTLWSKWSMLKSGLNIRKGIDLHQYKKLKAFLKRESKGYKPKQSATFSYRDIERFINETPDEIYLGLKVMAILGICCAMRCLEMMSLTTNNVVDMNPTENPTLPSVYFVQFPDAKNPEKIREYTIGRPFYDIIKKYINLRPTDVPNLHFLIKYQNGKFSRQNAGINTIGSGPRKIAELLKLANSEKFSGHAWRRSSATFIANAGGTLIDVKRVGGWNSDAVAQRYCDHNEASRSRLFGLLVKNSISTGTNKNHDAESAQSSTSRHGLEPPAKILKKCESIPQRSKRQILPSVKSQRKSSTVNIFAESNNQSAETWGEENEEWWEDVANNSVFLLTPEDPQEMNEEPQPGLLESSSTLPTNEGKVSAPPRADLDIEDTTNNQHQREMHLKRPMSSVTSNEKIKNVKIPITNDSKVTFNNCTIENIIIHNHNDKENRSPQ